MYVTMSKVPNCKAPVRASNVDTPGISQISRLPAVVRQVRVSVQNGGKTVNGVRVN